MNKQDLKEGQEVYVKGKVIHTGDHLDIVLANGSFIENAIVLHHKKPVVPQFVADWIEKVGGNLFGLNYDMVPEEIYDWVNEEKGNFKKLHLACAIGYEVEKEKRYTVKIKATKQYLCNDEIGPHFSPSFRSNFTKSDLEKLGFNWVFDCEGVEIEEVEE